MPTKPATLSPAAADVVKTAEEIAREIDAFEVIARALANTRLKQKAVLILLAHETGLPQTIVKRVLEGLGTLRASVLK